MTSDQQGTARPSATVDPQASPIPSPSHGHRPQPRWRRGLFTSETSTHPSAGRRWSSRVLHQVNAATAHSTTGLISAAIILGWVIYGIAARFPNWWDNVLFIVSSTITLLMVFAIQHTQARQQSAVQRKLDEILHALPHADDRLIALEEAPDAELDALATLDIAHREQAVDHLGAINPVQPESPTQE